MSGIAGIISLNRTRKVGLEEFELFFNPLILNKSKEKIIDNSDDFSIVGLAELEGSAPKYYKDIEQSVSIFLWGYVFIKGKIINQTEDEKYKEIIEIWKKHGEEVTERLLGCFNLIICDNVKHKYLLFNCRFGMMPLYYSVEDGVLYFSSGIRSFTSRGVNSRSLNKCSVLQYMIFNYQINNDTFLENVFSLPAAAFITNEHNFWRLNKYDTHTWLLQDASLSHEEGEYAINEVLNKSVGRILNGANTVGCSITGGWDGRLVLSYLTEFMKAADFFLYTYGKANHPDMIIAKDLAKKFDFNHVPVLLDEDFLNSYEDLAIESLILSGGLRAATRGHYLLMAKSLGEKTNIVISGNCASNILKIIQSPGAVYNQNVLDIFLSYNLEETSERIYTKFFKSNHWVRNFTGKDEFINALMNSEVLTDLAIPPEKRLYHYLLTNIERKYFGVEVGTYSSYIYNFSPFIDTEFIETIIKTPYFGGHYPILEKSPKVRYRLSKLYATLMKKRLPALANYKSDRGFPPSWFLTWYGRRAGYMIKKTRKYLTRTDPDPFNHHKGTEQLSDKWTFADEFFNVKESGNLNDDKIKALSWSYWHNNIFNKPA